MKDIWESLIWNPTFSQMSFISLSHQCHDSIQRHGETHYESVCVPTCISMEKTRCISMTVRWTDINDWHQSWVSWPLRFTLDTSMTSEVHTRHINGSHYTHEYRVRFMSDVTSLMTSEFHTTHINDVWGSHYTHQWRVRFTWMACAIHVRCHESHDVWDSHQWHWYESFISMALIWISHLFHIHFDVFHICRALLQVGTAILRVYRALLQVCKCNRYERRLTVDEMCVCDVCVTCVCDVCVGHGTEMCGYDRPTLSVMYVPLQVNRFAESVLLIVQYRYLKSCSGDFYPPESDPPHKIMRYWFYYSIWLGFSFSPDRICQSKVICIGGVPVSKRHFGGAGP